LADLSEDSYIEALLLQLARGDSACNATERVRSRAYRQGFLRCDRSTPNCSPKSKLCGNACVPKTKKCKSTTKLSRASSPDFVRQRVEAEEDKLKDLPYEHLLIIDSKTGDVLAHRTDNHPTQVGFDASDFPKIKGAIVTHNHPNAYGFPPSHPASKGISLSPPDIQVACTFRPKEMRAVSAGYRHVLSPGEKGWGDWNWRVKPVYEKHERQVMNEFQTDLILGRKAASQLEADYHHEINTRTAKELGWKYERQVI